MISGYNAQKVPFQIEAAKGNKNISSIYLFGRNTDVDTGAEEYLTDFWAGSYDFPNTAETFFISSSSPADTSVTIAYRCIDENWNVDDGVITLNGQTSVEVPGGPKLRALIAFNGGSVDLAGDVYIYRATTVTAGVPDDLTQVVMHVDPVRQQSSAALYTVPAGHTAYIVDIAMTVNRNTTGGSADVALNTWAYNGVRRMRADLGLQTAGSSSFTKPFDYPIRITEKTDIFLSANVSSNNHDLAGGFQLLLIKD